ncbi:MAG: hypothetical protein JWO54_50 [Candidatus Saccharibacteria bacterium]|jgi:hypothetical protein|nr:hypothetical protein [Candidatus Saccharibacteria bacterium]MDB5180292.1 hypothetical protein [Candidatus Saccharibacteria bacterium]
MNESEKIISEQEQIPANAPRDNSSAYQSNIKNSKKPFQLIAAFLLGALTCAVITGVYNFAIVEMRSEASRQAEFTSKSENQTQLPVEQGPTAVTDEDLAKFVNPQDCTSKQEYLNLKLSRSLMQIVTINLYDGMVIKNSASSGPVKWSTLPIVLDYQCKTIKITDLEIGDRVNVYTAADANNSELKLDIKMIQKANK